MYMHTTPLSSMTATWLLPIAPCVVASATGAGIAMALSTVNAQHALWTLITCYVLWGIGIPMAMVVLVLYFHRLAIYNLPPRETIVSVFIPLSPLGMGAYGIITMGKAARDIFPQVTSLLTISYL
jgi:tellurite resistance protein TehA-like permease